MKALFKNTASLILSRIAADFLFFGFYIWLTRRFGQTGIGIYSFAIALSSFAFIAANCGMNQYLIREVSRNRPELPYYMGRVLITHLGFGLLSLALMMLALPFLRLEPAGQWAFFFVIVSQGLYSLGTIYRSAFAAYEDLSQFAFAEVLYKASILVLGIFFLASNARFEQVMMVLPLAGLIYVAALARLAKRNFGRPKFQRNRPAFAESFKGAFPFLISTLLVSLAARLPTFVIQYFKGYAACGVYSAPFKLVELMLVFVGFFQMALFPSLSRLYVEKAEEHRQLYEKSIRYIVAFFTPVCILIFLMAEPIVLILFGKGFEASIPVLRILSLYLLVAAPRLVFLTALSSINEQWKWVASQSTGVGLNLVLGLILIPPAGPTGAALSLFLAEAFSLMLAYVYAERKIKRPSDKEPHRLQTAA